MSTRPGEIIIPKAPTLELPASTQGIYLPDGSINIPDTAYTFADDRVALDPVSRQVWADGELLEDFRPTGLRVLETIASKQGKIVPTEEIWKTVWPKCDVLLANVPVNINYIRARLGDDLRDAIKTKRSVGYGVASSLTDSPDLGQNDSPIYRAADDRVQIDLDSWSVRFDGEPKELTAQEFKLLAVLMKRANVVITYSSIFSLAWEDRQIKHPKASLHLMIMNIRKKMGPELGDHTNGAIRSVRKVGYCAVKSLSQGSSSYNHAAII